MCRSSFGASHRPNIPGYYSYDEAEEVDEKRFNMYTNIGITAEDMLGWSMRNFGCESHGARPVAIHVSNRKDLQALSCRSICLGSFQPWDVKKQVEIITRELDWQGDEVEGVPPEYNYERLRT